MKYLVTLSMDEYYSNRGLLEKFFDTISMSKSVTGVLFKGRGDAYSICKVGVYDSSVPTANYKSFFNIIAGLFNSTPEANILNIYRDDTLYQVTHLQDTEVDKAIASAPIIPMSEIQKVNLLSNFSALKELGTTNFFRLIKNSNLTGRVLIDTVDDQLRYLTFDRLFDKEEEPENLLTVSELIRSKQITLDTLQHGSIMIRAEIEKADYRHHRNPILFKAEITTAQFNMDTVLPYSKEVANTEQIDNYLENSFNTMIEVMQGKPEEKTTGGKVKGF